MRAAPIRCTARHPRDPGRECGEWLGNAHRSTVDVRKGDDPPPQCFEVRCRRCGTRYVVCPKAA